MLSRVADSLFWLSRQIERADNNARILSEFFFTFLDSDAHPDDELALWSPILKTCGDHDAFLQDCPQASTRDIVHYLTFDQANPTSIYSCIASGRSNAHMVRDQLSSELWEVINLAFHDLNRSRKALTDEEELDQLFETIQQVSFRFQGLLEATYPQDEGFHFMQLGKYLERAMGTVRILDLKYHILLPKGAKDVGGAVDSAQWVSILKACGALEAYYRVYLAEVNSAKVTELLVLTDSFPRSLRYCIQCMDQGLRRLSGTPGGRFSNDAEKISGKMISELAYSSVEDIFKLGLHEYLERARAHLATISESVFQEYMFLPTIDLSSEIQQQQQQQ